MLQNEWWIGVCVCATVRVYACVVYAIFRTHTADTHSHSEYNNQSPPNLQVMYCPMWQMQRKHFHFNRTTHQYVLHHTYLLLYAILFAAQIYSLTILRQLSKWRKWYGLLLEFSNSFYGRSERILRIQRCRISVMRCWFIEQVPHEQKLSKEVSRWRAANRSMYAWENDLHWPSMCRVRQSLVRLLSNCHSLWQAERNE